MARKLRSDRVLFLAAFLLVCASVVMVWSASVIWAQERYHQPYLFLFKQVTWAALGFFVLALLMRVDYRHYREPVVIWTIVAIVGVSLLYVLAFAPRINGTRRWFAVAGIGIQPSELAKIAVVLFTAAILERRMDRIHDLRYSVLPVALLAGIFAVLILAQPDLGTSFVLVATVAVMLFAAGLSYRYLVAGVGVAAPLLGLLIWLEPYRMQRLLIFIDPEKDPQGAGFQIIQSLIAVGTGGVTGLGLMESVQKRFFLPEPHTDFIYAVISEELGLVGATLILIAFCVITWRGLAISVGAPDRFGTFIALGLTTMIALQAFVNMSVVLGLMPTKGIPLPFVSAGGSSLLINLLGMGVLLNVSQHASLRR